MQSAEGRASFSRETVRRIAGFARPHRAKLILYLLLSTATALLGLVAPVLSGRVVDAIIGRDDAGVIIGLAVLIAVAAVASSGLGMTERWAASAIGEGVILDLRKAVYSHVQKMPVAFFTRTRTGALVSRLNNDVIGAQRAFTSALAGIFRNVITLIVTLIVMFTLSWQITLLALVLLPVFVIPARRVGRKVGKLWRGQAENDAAMSDQMAERFSAPGAMLVKLFGRPKQEDAEFGQRATRVRDLGVRTAMAMEVFIQSLTLVSMLAQALIYGLGGYLALTGSLQAGTVVSLGMLLTRLYGPLTELANARLEITTAMVSFDRVFEVLDLKPLITEPDDPRPLPGGPIAVEYDDVRFAYPSADQVSLASLEDVAVLDDRAGEQVLHGVSFRAEPGQTVALVGSSGAGKSTIVSLASRLYDVDSGAVRLGDVDVRDLSFDEIKRNLGVVTQDGHLFHTSIRANLRYARPDATDNELWDALKRARLEELIGSLPDQLDTVVGEGGYRFSGGERQRLTIARLLLARPRVVVLDEATAHLDSESEKAVQEALGEALQGRTAVVIAHRLSTIRAADQILVIEAGRIVERGTHDELLAASGRYAGLYETQFAVA